MTRDRLGGEFFAALRIGAHEPAPLTVDVEPEPPRRPEGRDYGPASTYHDPFCWMQGTGDRLPALVPLLRTWSYTCWNDAWSAGMPADGSLLLLQPVLLLHMLPVTSTSASDPDIWAPETVALPVKADSCASDACWVHAACALGTL